MYKKKHISGIRHVARLGLLCDFAVKIEVDFNASFNNELTTRFKNKLLKMKVKLHMFHILRISSQELMYLFYSRKTKSSQCHYVCLYITSYASKPKAHNVMPLWGFSLEAKEVIYGQILWVIKINFVKTKINVLYADIMTKCAFRYWV